VARALDFDETAVRQVISNIDKLKEEFQTALAACLAFFPEVDRTVEGYEGLLAAQACLPDNDTRDAFAAEYSLLARLWEAISPDPPFLGPYRADYRWLSQVYESVKPPSGQGKLLWHALGAKTLDLIHENIYVETIRDDLETLILDADFLAELEAHQNPTQIKELEIKIIKRLQKHKDKPQFIQLGLRLENLKQLLAQGQMTSLEYLKKLLEIAREVVNAEKQIDPVEERKSAKAALTELFQETRAVDTPVMVERIVNDIDSIVRVVRFDGWQTTSAGEREVKKALRKTLMKYKLHTEHELFDKAYEYIKEYY
jgi:type I restriction enzyme R subunit